MSYDFYVELGGESENDVDTLTNGRYCGVIIDVPTRIRLLAGIAAYNGRVKDYAVSGDRKQGGGYKSLVHAKNPPDSPYAKALIVPEQARLDALGLLKPTAPDLSTLPLGSWFLQFTFTLAKPWISKDDDPFYVAESVNPVRKDKVFKVPMIAASSWKGVLRWTMMHTRLALKKNDLDDKAFAEERLAQTLLLGDEKGEEAGKTKDFTGFLDQMKPDARSVYAQLLRRHFQVMENKPLPHHAGRLRFFPTFFNLIDVEVINPHSRETKAGTHPIYLECVPAGAQGTFSLLYVPFDRIGRDDDATRAQATEDLLLLAQGLQATFCIYGFGAKTSSGFGVAEARVKNASFVLNAPDKPPAPPKPTEPQIPPEVQDFQEKYPNEDFQLKPKAWCKQPGATNSQRGQYIRARGAYRKYKEQYAAYEKTLSEWESAADAPTPALTPRSFTTFNELITEAQKLAQSQQGGAE